VDKANQLLEYRWPQRKISENGASKGISENTVHCWMERERRQRGGGDKYSSPFVLMSGQWTCHVGGDLSNYDVPWSSSLKYCNGTQSAGRQGGTVGK
jgi:hypothetical protein